MLVGVVTMTVMPTVGVAVAHVADDGGQAETDHDDRRPGEPWQQSGLDVAGERAGRGDHRHTDP
ncbi:Uncharacterised protein [Mycobacteroides abscessus subsp. abscessus]|nr:Uncharacterised protein [Mycobacteroides abscessus subsp. abscessus]SKV10516.1 Uncharacterised protein [Mycobacteroides abscessus subsp. abscessus]